MPQDEPQWKPSKIAWNAPGLTCCVCNTSPRSGGETHHVGATGHDDQSKSGHTLIEGGCGSGVTGRAVGVSGGVRVRRGSEHRRGRKLSTAKNEARTEQGCFV